MSTLDGSVTTIPAESTKDGQKPRGSLAICWVFPLVPERIDEVKPGRSVLGRAEDCAMRLSGGEISRTHAELLREGPACVIRDLGSTNGVFHNGVRVAQARLRELDIVRLGEWVGIVLASISPGAEPPVYAEIAQGLFGGPALRALAELAQRAAKSGLPVVVEGETGTGKELFSRAVHAFSARSGPFVAVNCAALPHSVAEAELFGYRKGAFTGADRSSLGHFRAAHGGTLLLDEVIDMPPPLQAKVLRVLEEREVLPLGESTPVPVDVQIVAAAQSPLRAAVAEQRFRADLVARLCGVTLRLPPLRERREEVPRLFLRLLNRHSGGSAPLVEAKLVERLCLYDWPFNVRELDLLVRQLLALHGGEPLLRRAHLPREFSLDTKSSETLGATAPADSDELAPRERDRRDLEALLVALRKHNGNVARASAAVNITRQRAYRLMEGRADVSLEELRYGSPIARDAQPSRTTLGTGSDTS